MLQSIAKTLTLAVSLTIMSPAAHAAVEQEIVPVDLALVLAADISGSMNRQEIRLQREAYVRALQDPRVITAIQSGQHGRIAIAYVEWSRTGLQLLAMPFRVIGSPQDAHLAAQRIVDWASDGDARGPRGGGTSISAALAFAHELLAASPYDDARWVIDISGDGVNNDGSPPDGVRDMLVEAGVVVNGLPIVSQLNEDEAYALERYYASCVIGGIGAFQLVVRDADRLAESLAFKMVLEIAGDHSDDLPAEHIILTGDSPAIFRRPIC